MSSEESRMAVKNALLASVAGITTDEVAQVARSAKPITIRSGLRAGAEPFIKLEKPIIHYPPPPPPPSA